MSDIKREFNYAIAIRTLGTSGEKYVKLLNSIRRLNIQPSQIVVVMPEGTQAPSYSIGTETIVYSSKGMIPQRIYALKMISAEYTLFCDDDIELSSNFIEKISEPLLDGEYDCSAGPLLDFFPPAGTKYLLASLLGGACVMLRGRNDTYVKILKTGGWSYNRNIDLDSHKIYKTESLPWTCYFIRTDVMRAIHFEDEIWAERTGYAAFEDRMMFYKLKVNGYQTCVVSDACYRHNDAKTSTRSMGLEPYYAGAFNHYVFWHRFLYSQNSAWSAKKWCELCINYYIIMQRLYYFLLMKTGRVDKQICQTIFNAFNDAKKFISSEEYRKIPAVKCNDEGNLRG